MINTSVFFKINRHMNNLKCNLKNKIPVGNYKYVTRLTIMMIPYRVS